MMQILMAAVMFMAILLTESGVSMVVDRILLLVFSFVYMISTTLTWSDRMELKEQIKTLEELHKAELREKQIEDYKKGLKEI